MSGRKRDGRIGAGHKSNHVIRGIYQLYYGQFTSRVTSISENEMNIPISLCNVRHVNGMLNISLEIFPKKAH